MKTKLVLRLMSQERLGLQGVLCAFLILCLYLQSGFIFSQLDSLKQFDYEQAAIHAQYYKCKQQKDDFLRHAKRTYIKNNFFNTANHTQANEKLNNNQSTCSSCSNLDFEENSLNGWVVNGDYEIMSSGTDVFGQFPTVFPGAGKHSLRLNNNSCTNKVNFKSSISKSFLVSSQNAILNVHFAMVILNFPHDKKDAANFKLYLRDASNNILPCPQFNCYYADQTGPVGVNNFSLSAIKGLNIAYQEFPVSYASWQSIGLDLSSYIGTTVKLEIECNWCKFDYDWAYCYLDADCEKPIIPTAKCVDVPATLKGPAGMGAYKWLMPDGTVSTSTTQSLLAYQSGVYTLQCSYNQNCFSVPINYYFNLKANPVADFEYSVKPCQLSIDLTSKVPANLIPIQLSYKWYFGDGTVELNQPTVHHTYSGMGNKTIKLIVINKEACSDTLIKTISLSAPVSFSIQNVSGVSFLSDLNQQLIFKAYSTYPYANLQYNWFGQGLTLSSSSIAISNPGTYMVIAIDPKTKCTDTNWVYVDLASKLQVPNVFTPNHDGKNDEFKLLAENVKEIDVQIFDRWGNLVYKNEEAIGNFAWDGTNLQGRSCADGVFYYLLQANGYDGQSYACQGTVSLFR